MIHNAKISRAVRRAVQTVLFLVLLAGSMFLAARLVERKDSREKNGDYFAAAVLPT